MSQEAITEFDMDVFSRRISPYFTWLESKIESGWQQSDAVQKDILKEVRYLATNMRARFILGISKDDFAKEVRRTLELFELACEAFPQESEEVEGKTEHFCKGILGELGGEFLPDKYRTPETQVKTAEVKTAEAPLKAEAQVETPIKPPSENLVKKPAVAAEKPKMAKEAKPTIAQKTQIKKTPAAKIQALEKPKIVMPEKPKVVATKPIKKATPEKQKIKQPHKQTQKIATNGHKKKGLNILDFLKNAIRRGAL